MGCRTRCSPSHPAEGVEVLLIRLIGAWTKITKEHYIRPDGRVGSVTADILEALAPRRGGDRDVA